MWRFVLEVAYGVKGARASCLKAPALSADIPVQQTLWRPWIPDYYLVLGHDRVFSIAKSWQVSSLIRPPGRQASVGIGRWGGVLVGVGWGWSDPR